MKKVLFFGPTFYNLSFVDPALRTKFSGLNKICEIHVMARGLGWRAQKYGVLFWLTPKKYGFAFWLAASFFRSWLIIVRKKIDVIVAQSPAFDGMIGVFLKILTGCRLVVEVHGDWIESPFLYHKILFPKFFRLLLILSGKFSLRQADKIRTISQFTEDLANKYGGRDKPKCCFPTFTDISKFLEGGVCNNLVGLNILYVGVLYRLKGVHFLIRALSRVRLRHPEVSLNIIGDGPYRSELENLVKELNLGGVKFFGQLPSDEVVKRMRDCSVLVLPSLSEGLGRVLIEAAAVGKPVVGSRVGGIPEVIEDGQTGFLFPPGDVSALACKLEWVFDHPKQAKLMGERGRKLVEERFSTQAYFRSFKNLIEF